MNARPEEELPAIRCDSCRERRPMREMREVFGPISSFAIDGPVLCDRCYAIVARRASERVLELARQIEQAMDEMVGLAGDDSINDFIAEEYPFDLSLDEVAMSVNIWRFTMAASLSGEGAK